MVRLSALVSALILAAWASAQSFTLTILHTNDMHAHVEQTRVSGMMLGGYARQATLIKRLRASDPNVVLLNGGDTFQGTIFFNTYEGLADLAFMNAVKFDAMAVGNHEFDKGPGLLGEFARAAAFPVLAANLDVSAEPALNGVIKPSAVLTVGGQRVGVVGAVTEELPTISFMGDNVKMLGLVSSCQAAIDALRSQGIDKIVMVTHVGYREEIALARSLSGVDVIVGGHSHTLLGSTGVEGLPTGPDYPTVVKNKDGDTALVVQAWHWGLVLGRIQVTFDSMGRVTGHTGAPVAVTEDIAEDPVVASMVRAFNRPIAAMKDKVIGATLREIPRGDSNIAAQLIADAQLEATQHLGSVAAFINAGGVRAAIDAGDITYGEALMVQPFGNTLVVIELKGSELAAALSRGGGGTLLPSRGTSYELVGGTARNIVVAGAPLDPSRTYKVTVNNFTAGGGDNHVEIKAATGARVESGIVDVDALIEYIKKRSPLDLVPENRVKTGTHFRLAG
ncbi:MAG: bifunctional metallophosphatase/5'-nucleotidase [Fimbriimonadaceae bacterium]